MAFTANIHFDRIAFFGGTGFEGGSAGAGNRYLVIIGMYIGFHRITSLRLLSFVKMLTYYILF